MLLCASHCAFVKIMGSLIWILKPLPDDKILGLPKKKTFADHKLNVNQNVEVVFHWIGKHCGKRRKCWLPVFSSFPTMFSKGFSLQCVKSRHCMVKG